MLASVAGNTKYFKWWCAVRCILRLSTSEEISSKGLNDACIEPHNNEKTQSKSADKFSIACVKA